MPGRPSLLTASLHAGVKQEHAVLAEADTLSFPCLLAEAPSPAVPHVPGFDGNVHSLPGSAPTAIYTPGSLTVDYGLSPFQPRGGKEVLPREGPASLKDPASRNLISEAVIGSLPPALSHVERASVTSATPLSSTLTLLSSLPSDKLQSRCGEGRDLRRSVLHGAVLVFVTAGYSGKRFVFETAKELGVRIIIIDGPDSWSKVLVEEGVVEKFIALDMSDASSVFDRCLEAIEGVRRELGDLDGVLSFCEMAQPLVARLAERLGLPGNSPAAVDAARDKHETRDCLKAAGLPTPRNFLITSAQQLKEASDVVGYPAVIKPVCGAASIGVVRVNDYEHLQTEYAKVVRELATAKVVAGALMQGDEDEDDCCSADGHDSASGSGRSGADGGSLADANNEEAGGGNASAWIKTNIMMEEYLDGPEVDVDLVFSGGQAVYGAVTDNWDCIEPFFNETGSNAPSILPKEQQRELLDLGVKSVQALGFDAGVFHVECKYTKNGARLIEVNCRMGGGAVRNINLLVWGVDLVEEQLLCSAGIPTKPAVAPAPLRNIAEYSVNAQRTGILRDFSFLDKYQDAPGVFYARPMVAAGSKVYCVDDNLPTWVAEFMCTRPTIEETIEYAKELEADMQRNMIIDPLPRRNHSPAR